MPALGLEDDPALVEPDEVDALPEDSGEKPTRQAICTALPAEEGAGRAGITEKPTSEGSDPSGQRNRDGPNLRRRRRRRRRREDEGNVILETFYYYTAAFGIFPWALAGLVVISCCMGGVSLFIPGLPLAVVVYGAVVYNAGWFWLLVTAFRDDSFQGMLCLFTHFYWIAYFFMNAEEAWKPVALMILGVIVIVFGAIMLGVSAAVHNPELALALLTGPPG